MKFHCHLPAIPLRKEASDRSEMISQLLFGENVEVLDANEKWCVIRGEADGYEGWVDKKQLKSGHHETDRILPFPMVGTSEHYSVLLPAGARILGHTASVGDKTYTLPEITISQPSVLQTALQFMNVPYLWGGKTLMGIDCSGFTQVVFSIIGKQLLRDAYQQAEQGEGINFIEEAQTGDLAFFDNAEGRIIHVGIVIKDPHHTHTHTQIIHASGQVRIDDLDHQGIFNRQQKEYSHNLRMIRRF